MTNIVTHDHYLINLLDRLDFTFQCDAMRAYITLLCIGKTTDNPDFRIVRCLHRTGYDPTKSDTYTDEINKLIGVLEEYLKLNKGNVAIDKILLTEPGIFLVFDYVTTDGREDYLHLSRILI